MATTKRKTVVIPTPVAVVDVEVGCYEDASMPTEWQGNVQSSKRKVEGFRKKHMVSPQKTQFDTAGRFQRKGNGSRTLKELKFTLSSAALKPEQSSKSNPFASQSRHLSQTESFHSFKPTYRPLLSHRLHLMKVPEVSTVQSPTKQITPSLSQLSIMDYFHLFSSKPDIGRRTPHTNQRRAASKAGYRTKLQKDPVLQRSPLGAYSYADCYELDEPFLRKMFRSVSSRQGK